MRPLRGRHLKGGHAINMTGFRSELSHAKSIVSAPCKAASPQGKRCVDREGDV